MKSVYGKILQNYIIRDSVIVEFSIRAFRVCTRIIEYIPMQSMFSAALGTKRDLRRLLHLVRKLKTRGKTRSADTCHEHRWSSPSLTSHFQPISRISSTFCVVLAIARFHAPSGLIGTDVLRGDRIKQKFRTIAFDRDAYCAAARMLSSFIYGKIVIVRHANYSLMYSTLSRYYKIY